MKLLLIATLFCLFAIPSLAAGAEQGVKTAKNNVDDILAEPIIEAKNEAKFSDASTPNCELSTKIGNRFAVFRCKDIEKGTNFKSFSNFGRKLQKETNVKELTLLFYAPEKNPGEGILAAMLFGKEKPMGHVVESVNEETALKLEKIGESYAADPKELCTAYEDNSVVADEEFKDKPLFFSFKSGSVSKDMANRPYIRYSVPGSALGSLIIYVPDDDPLIRKVKKGQKIMIKAYPQYYMVTSVFLNGELIDVEEPKKAKKK